MQIGGSQLEQKIAGMISESVASIGFEIVRIRFIEGRRKTLQIMIDHIDGSMITAKDCAKVSRHVSAILDVDDPIPGEYDLEMSSPGIDRPLVRAKDFEQYKGHEAKISMTEQVNGRKHFKGKLLGITGTMVQLQPDNSGEPVELDFDNISSAKLILTDALIAEAMKQQATQDN